MCYNLITIEICEMIYLIKYYMMPTIIDSFFVGKYEPQKIIKENYEDLVKLEKDRIFILYSEPADRYPSRNLIKQLMALDEKTSIEYEKHNMPRYIIVYQDPNMHEENEYYELASNLRVSARYFHECSYNEAKIYYDSCNYKKDVCKMFNLRESQVMDYIKDFDELKPKEDYRKKEYNTDDLVIANLVVAESNMIFIGTTDHKYIFEKVTEDGKEKYREIFTGFVAEKTQTLSDVPYLKNIVPLNEEVEYVGEISKIEALLLLNQINPKNTNNVNVYKDANIAPFNYEKFKKRRKNLAPTERKDKINRKVSTTGFSNK